MNVAVSTITTVGNMVVLLPYLLRILVGPLHPTLVAVAYYNIRATLTITISLLTAKTVLMTAFILRFGVMTGEVINFDSKVTDVCIVLASGSQISFYQFQIISFFYLSQRVYPGYTFGYLHQLGKQIDK